ncbi:MAG: VanZ family protein [Marinagarivorans sp.]|nr:VanZ family protein [Marinagarivorans sp.]
MSRLNHFMAKTRPLRLLQFFVAIIIFCYAALTPSPQQILGQHADSYMHFLGNFLLYLSAWLALWRRISIFKLLLCLIPFSAAVEVAQYFSPPRTVDPHDFLANLAGLAAAALVCAFFQWVLRRI